MPWPIVLLGALSAQVQADLVAAAAASGRPPECFPLARRGGSRPSVWSRARRPQLTRYCQLVARAQARLAERPEAARKAAREADKVLPGRAAPQVLLARIAHRRGDHKRALAAFDRAIAIDRHAPRAPLAMVDYARTLRAAGKLERALTAYRSLVPRASLLPNRAARAGLLLEAAHASTTWVASHHKGAEPPQSAFDEALAYLREATRDPHHNRRREVVLMLALTLDRSGRTAEADAVLSAHRDLHLWAKSSRATDKKSRVFPVLEADVDALAALALEARQPAAAAARWAAFIKRGPKSLRPAAKRRMARLASGGKRRSRGAR